MLQQLEDLVASVNRTAAASVVSVGRNGRGSGFVVAKDRIVTSAHNLRDRTLAVTFADGRAVQGEVHGFDADGDLAVVAV